MYLKGVIGTRKRVPDVFNTYDNKYRRLIKKNGKDYFSRIRYTKTYTLYRNTIRGLQRMSFNAPHSKRIVIVLEVHLFLFHSPERGNEKGGQKVKVHVILGKKGG